jgi:hypothetical protein
LSPAQGKYAVDHCLERILKSLGIFPLNEKKMPGLLDFTNTIGRA